MFHSNNTTLNNQQMPGSIPQNDNYTQLNQQRDTALNNHTNNQDLSGGQTGLNQEGKLFSFLNDYI